MFIFIINRGEKKTEMKEQKKKIRWKKGSEKLYIFYMENRKKN